MWIFLSDAFLSVVADKADPFSDRLLVRACRAGDIERVFPEAEVFSLDGADYPCRSWLPRFRVAQACLEQIKAIDYENFKDSISDPEYHEAAMGGGLACNVPVSGHNKWLRQLNCKQSVLSSRDI